MEELILKAKKGDKEAFTQAILMLKNDLYKIAKSKISNEDDIQDIIQETMLYAYKYIKTLKEINKFKIWVIKILINNCNKYYKKNAKNKELYENYDIEFFTNNVKFADDKEKLNDTLNFYEMIKDLDSNERVAIVLFYGQNYTTKEISKILGINENTIKTRIARAREKIKKNYKGGIYND